MGAEARYLGRGGVAAVARVAGVTAMTVRKGLRELESGVEVAEGVRASGAGRPRAVERDPGLLEALDALVEPETRGDPETPLRWTTKSTRNLAAELTESGHPIGHAAVGRILAEMGYSLQANAKTLEGKQHPDRDAQFRYIHDTAKEFTAVGEPVISVDTKNKQMVGQYRNGGTEWQPAGRPVRVKTHDFPDKDMPKAVPYGVFDQADNSGWVSVGTSGDTGAFAVETIRRWWNNLGQARYPKAARLLITADSGGSNSARGRLWKVELAAFAVESGLEVTVLHYPAGTSKWNRIEHHMFNHISMNWRGRPLPDYEAVVELISHTTTSTGLTIHAELDTGDYPRGIKISNAQLKRDVEPYLTRHETHGQWNYTLNAAT